MRSWVYLDQVTDDSPQSPARFTSHLRKSRRVQSSRQYRVASHQRWLTLSNRRRLYCFAPRGLSFPTLGWNYNFFNLGGFNSVLSSLRHEFRLWPRRTSFCRRCSPTWPSARTRSRLKPSSLTVGPTPRRRRSSNVCISRCLWEWRRNPRFRARTARSSQYAASGVFLCAVISL